MPLQWVEKNNEEGLPTRLRIFSQYWDVKYVDKLSMNDSDLNDKYEIVGNCDSISRTIYIGNFLPLESKKEVLLHEIGHAYIQSIPNMKKIKRKQEEVFCDWFSMFLLDLVRNNEAFWEM